MTVTYYFGEEGYEEPYETELDWKQCHEAIASSELQYYNHDREAKGLPAITTNAGTALIEHFLGIIDDTDNIIETFSEEIKDYWEEKSAKQWSEEKAETEERNRHPYYWK